MPGHAAALVTADDEVPGSLGIEVVLVWLRKEFD